MDYSGTVSYAYDLLDRLTEVRDRQGGVTSYAYDPDGLLLEVKRPNGTKSILTYDGVGQIEIIRNLDKGGAELSFYRCKKNSQYDDGVHVFQYN